MQTQISEISTDFARKNGKGIFSFPQTYTSIINIIYNDQNPNLKEGGVTAQ